MLAVAHCAIAVNVAHAGIYAPAAGNAGSTAIAKDDARFVEWASGAELVRGPVDISATTPTLASYGTVDDALGNNSGLVSLGDGGMITLTFDNAIQNGDGFDFAIFENGFSDTFLELGFVEVSSDGSNFFRFDAVSQTQTDTQIGGFGAVDCTDLYNFAGKYRANYGTPFDLSELDGTVGLDVNNIGYVRIIDVVGSIDDAYCSYDSQGNKVNDPYKTGFPSGGFDLDAVGVLNVIAVAVPEPATILLFAFAVPFLMIRRKNAKK